MRSLDSEGASALQQSIQLHNRILEAQLAKAEAEAQEANVRVQKLRLENERLELENVRLHRW